MIVKEDESLRQQAEEAVSSAWSDMFGRDNGECARLDGKRVGTCTMEVEPTDWYDEGRLPILHCSECAASFSMDGPPMYCPVCGRRVIWTS